MKVLQIIPNKGWCLDKLFSLIKPTDDIQISKFYMDTGNTDIYEDCDIIHFHFWANMPEYKMKPTIVTIQHIEFKDEIEIITRLKRGNPDIIIAANNHSHNILKRHGLQSVIIRNTTEVKPVIVGYLGLDTEAERHYKNYEVIDEACRILGLLCDGQRRNRPELKFTEDELDRWYRSLNVFVTANSLPGSTPAMEALACGTPVIATPISLSPQEWNVTYFDGTVEDLVRKLKNFIPKFIIIPEEYSKKHLELYKLAQDKFYK